MLFSLSHKVDRVKTSETAATSHLKSEIFLRSINAKSIS